jgi:deoxycytidylate deaminase
MHGPCAKQTVTATIVTRDGARYTGTNDCDNAQTECPRYPAGYRTGEGYHLCRQICQQTAHAEINALRAAGMFARDAVMFIEGHTYACASCTEAINAAGIRTVVFSAPPV